MLIPLRTSRAAKRRPIVTEGLILVNMLVFLAGLVGETGGAFTRTDLVRLGALERGDFDLPNLITYQFLHDPSSVLHLGFNMLFLWVFGGAVEDRLGRTSYLAFYLLGGAVAGGAHVLASPAPVIGASGAVAGVSGAFLALFPRAQIRVLVFFFIIGIYMIPATWVIGFYFLIDLLRQGAEWMGGGGSRTAYAAHLAGYAWGFLVAVALLALKVLPRDDFDVFFLFTQKRRRAAFRRATRGVTGGAFESASADTARRLERERTRGRTRAAGREPRRPQERDEGPSDAMRAATSEARAEIARLVAEHRTADAAERYLKLLEIAPGSMLAADAQLDVANHLASSDHAREAADAYEALLRAHPAHPQARGVRLLLASLCLRDLDDRPRARAALDGIARSALADGELRMLEQLERDLAADGESSS